MIDFENSERLKDEAKKYKSFEFELFLAELGWEDWMNDYLVDGIDNDEYISDKTAKRIDDDLKEIFDAAQSEKKYYVITENSVEVNIHRKEIEELCSTGMNYLFGKGYYDSDPHVYMVFDNEEDAMCEFRKLKTTVDECRGFSRTFYMVEYYELGDARGEYSVDEWAEDFEIFDVSPVFSYLVESESQRVKSYYINETLAEEDAEYYANAEEEPCYIYECLNGEKVSPGIKFMPDLPKRTDKGPIR